MTNGTIARRHESLNCLALLATVNSTILTVLFCPTIYLGSTLQIIKLFQAILALAMLCSPVWLHSGTVSIYEPRLSELAGLSCHLRQPDLSLGKVIYVKGQAAINGNESVAGTPLRSGDAITTGADGFVAVMLGDGKRISVQPLSHLRVNCITEMAADTVSDYKIGQAYMSGAIRG